MAKQQKEESEAVVMRAIKANGRVTAGFTVVNGARIRLSSQTLKRLAREGKITSALEVSAETGGACAVYSAKPSKPVTAKMVEHKDDRACPEQTATGRTVRDPVLVTTFTPEALRSARQASKNSNFPNGLFMIPLDDAERDATRRILAFLDNTDREWLGLDQDKQKRESNRAGYNIQEIGAARTAQFEPRPANETRWPPHPRWAVKLVHRENDLPPLFKLYQGDRCIAHVLEEVVQLMAAAPELLSACEALIFGADMQTAIDRARAAMKSAGVMK